VPGAVVNAEGRSGAGFPLGQAGAGGDGVELFGVKYPRGVRGGRFRVWFLRGLVQNFPVPARSGGFGGVGGCVRMVNFALVVGALPGVKRSARFFAEVGCSPRLAGEARPGFCRECNRRRQDPAKPDNAAAGCAPGRSLVASGARRGGQPTGPHHPTNNPQHDRPLPSLSRARRRRR
jgi:hypothetical protein